MDCFYVQEMGLNHGKGVGWERLKSSLLYGLKLQRRCFGRIARWKMDLGKFLQMAQSRWSKLWSRLSIMVLQSPNHYLTFSIPLLCSTKCLKIIGSPRKSWQPIMTDDTTTSSYWLNWRVLLCIIWVLLTQSFALFLIWKYECRGNKECDRDETQKEEAGALYDDETWRPCFKEMHPAWLLAYRVLSFCVLLVLLIVTAVVDGADIFYFYTQWTFASTTIYFLLGSLLSINGCYQYQKKVSGEKVDNVEGDAEQGTSAGGNGSITSNTEKKSYLREEHHLRRQPAGLWGYVFQIIFQMNAGAVMLTDCVFWFIIVPFLAIKDYNLNFLIINMHTINAVFLLGDTALNSLRFPWFRIGYFFLWTVVFVIFQWIVHAFVRLWWPYPFLDLSSSYAPLWYLFVSVMHFPCYGIFMLIIRLKHHVFSTRCPRSYQYTR